jgi:DNA-directed RNA polymerase specialized sigma24 family protein
MAPLFRQVALTEIALDDRTFIVTYRPEMHALQRSIAHIGVLTPVHLRRPADQSALQVVCGSKRLLACQQTGHTSVPALVYSAAELPEPQAFLLALHDNLGCRVLNAVEKARILWRLRQEFAVQPATLQQQFCPLLDLPPRAETLHAYCALATLEDALQELPEEQRNVFMWNELEGVSFKDIADRTGEKVNTLISRKRYAVLYLRERLQDLYNEIINY